MGITASLSKGLDITGDVLKQAMEFHKEKFFELLKYYLVSFAIGIAGTVGMLIPIAILAFLLISAIAVGWIALVGAAILGIIALAMMVAAAVFATSAIFASIRYVMSGQKEKYLQNRDYKPALGYILFVFLVDAAAFLLFLGVPLLLMFGPFLAPLLGQDSSASAGLMMGGFLLGYLLMFVGMFLFVLFIAAFNVIFIYGIYEIAAEGLAPVAALKRSYALLKSNFWETIAFLVLMFGVGYAVGLASNIIVLPLMIISMIFPPFLIVSLPVFLAVSLAVRALMAPLYVFFWQRIRATNG